MNKQIIIDYEEYLELLKYKEMVEEAKNNYFNDSYNYPPSINKYTQYKTGCRKLIDYLKDRDEVSSIELNY